jgi:ABC-2 type transport system ATP-binding protein
MGQGSSPLAAVETRQLVKTYPGVQALKGISLRIEKGEIFALLGPNGAGKTTWISTVCGLVRPTSGQASVLGYDVTRASLAARRQIGLVPQEVNFDPFFTPREVLRFQMGYYGLLPDDKRIEEVLDHLDLLSKADANTRTLSGGMKRRLLIAKALVHRPGVAFLDEPTAGVDVALRRDLWSYVRRLREEGTTIVLTTHYLEEAEALADRVAVIDRGLLLCLDSPQALVRQHGGKNVRFHLARPFPGEPEALPAPLRALGATLTADRMAIQAPVDAKEAHELLKLGINLLPYVVEVETVQASLEDVFIKLTDHEAPLSPASP